MIYDIWPILSVVIGILLLLILIMKVKLNTFIALIVTAVTTGILLGMPLDKIMTTIETGMGGTLGHIALIFGLGAMLGKLLADGGGATQIADTLIAKLGQRYVMWAMVIASFIIGIALFFEVGLVLLIPLVFTIAKRMKISQLTIGLPMVTALSVTHGFLPPHPGPVVIAKELNANIGEVLLYGFIVAIPVTIIAGPLFVKLAPRLSPQAFYREGDISSLGASKSFDKAELPSFKLSTFTALLPVILMLINTVWQLISGHQQGATNFFERILYFTGSAGTAMLLAVIFAIYSMGLKQRRKMSEVMDSVTQAIYPIGMMILIIGGGGAFKQILIDGGVGKTIEHFFIGSQLSPLLLAWLVAALLRLALGSATVAAISTTGIILPLLQTADVNLALVVLAIGAGSVFCSHVNDAGFWMFKEYFGLTVKETFLTWSLVETIISVSGLVFVYLLSLIV
ncbi:gluconate:H+ symporter [Staphylococcus agnetis]|uniref:gluconate:H+ symporter n=1 Tax=Staphylococcus agnetis TaxID=985762 RepID=UPI000D19AE8B|nr:gluconate:H+ symporter [Staphylococcus agnetis]PTH59031.1 gluconate permease [Staphylococcus agnetis]